VRQAGDAGAPLSTGDLAARFDAIATGLAGQLGL
jgi:hypothetical protein